MSYSSHNSDIPEYSEKLVVIDNDVTSVDIDFITNSLKQDKVVLVQNTNWDTGDNLMRDIANHLGLKDALDLQSGFADLLGERKNISKHFMTVSKRGDYQFITPHSEGSRFSGMQLAAIFCHENSTDGGVSTLLNVDSNSHLWQTLRERVTRGRLTRGPLPRHEILRARGLHQLNLPADALKPDDQILKEYNSDIPGLIVVEALAKPEKSYCRILQRDVNVYWNTVDSNDLDSPREYARLLKKWGLLREPPGGVADIRQMDVEDPLRVWSSGLDYSHLFRCRITRKLIPGDFIIQNNLTWAHSASNWSPDSGIRRMGASFA